MFRFHKPLDVITLFHRPQVQPSIRALAIMKRLSAQASETATEDQASDHQAHNRLQRAEFELDVQEQPPTGDQLRSIIEYLGNTKASSVVEGSRDLNDAVKRLSEDENRFRAPVIVDWNNGKAVVGDNESQILKMLNALSSENQT